MATIQNDTSTVGLAVNGEDFSSSGILNTDGEETTLTLKKAISKPEVSKKKAVLVGSTGGLEDNILCENLDHFSNYDDLQRLISEYAKTDVQGRTYTHIQSMHQNIDILKLMYEKIEKFSKQTRPEEFPKNIEVVINSKDRYGNTPLLLACVYDDDEQSGSKVECVKYLLQLGADPNVQNNESGFTALHWASRYGETEIVDLLLNNKDKPAIEYIPDLKGYMPVDFAGMFKHYDVVKRLIELTHSRIVRASSLDNSMMTPDINHSMIPCLNLIIQNPMLQSTLLYWASALPENSQGISTEQLKFMFLDGSMQTYPEMNIYVANGKTALHAAAQSGNANKLTALIEEVKKRTVEDQTKEIFMKSIKMKNQNKSFEALMKSKNLKQYNFNLQNFYSRMKELTGKQEQRWINFQCEDGLSPLHLTCQLNHKTCTEILLIYNGASLDVTADSGLRPRDLIQHAQIKSTLQDYFNRVDRAIQNAQSADLKELKKSGTLKLKDKGDKAAPSDTIKPYKSKAQDKGNDVREKEIDEDCLQSLLWTYIKNKPEDWDLIHRALKDRNWLPETMPMLVIKMRVPKSQQKRLNNIISSLVKQHFIVRMFPGVQFDDEYYLLLELSQECLENYAEELKYPMRYASENLKSPFDRSFKNEFQPFRSKDCATIMEMIIDEKIPRHELEQLMTIKFFMHNFYEIQTIEAKHRETSLYEFFSQNSFVPTMERKEEFNAINALKNYFGERQGFLYAFKNYYTAWLTVPALLGIVLTVESFISGEYISLLSYAFAIFMSLWITMLIEFWKRKQNQFRQIWGTLVDKDYFSKKIRPQFVSNEEFSHINFEVMNQDTRKYCFCIKRGIVFKFLSRVFMTILITITVTVFLILKQVDLGIYTGVINGLVSNITSYTFTMTVVWFNTKENHKHEDQFINSLIQKVFFFKFINTNITIIWTIYQTDENADFQNLYSYIFGFILQKIAMLFFWRVIVKYATFKYNKWTYFKLCNEKAKLQRERHKKTMQKMKNSSFYVNTVADMEKKEASREHIEIFRHLKDEKQLEYKRLVTVFDHDKERAKKRAHHSSYTCMQADQLLIDQVELNSRMNNMTMPMEIFDLSEDFILCAFATLYSFICPTIALLIFVSRMFMARFERNAHLHLRVRQPILHQNGLGFWLTILESIGYFTVILNVWFLYNFKNQFADFIRTKFQFFLDVIFISVIEDKTLKETAVDDPNLADDLSFYQDGVDTEKILQEASPETLKQLIRAALLIIQRQDSISQFIFIIVAGEHLIILIKVLIDICIGDVSSQVKNKQIRVEALLEDIDDQLKNKQSDLEIDALNKKIIKQRKTFKKIIDIANDRYQDIAEKANIYHEESLKQIQKEQEMFVGELDKVETGRRSTIQTQSGRKKSAISQIDSVRSRRSSQVTRNDDTALSQAPSLAKSSVRDMSNISPPPMSKGSHLMIPGGSPLKTLSPIKTLPKFIKTKPSLTGFLEEALGNMNLEYGLEQKLNRQMQIRLYRETYLMIERNLLQKRLVQIGSLSDRVVINCSECMESRAIFQCHDFQDDWFCQKCFSEVQQSYSNNNFSKIGKGQKEQNIPTLSEGNKDLKKIKQWQKFEQFNFPFQIHNESYGQLKLYFTMIKNIYVHMNNINDETLKIDIVKYLIDQNYNILGEKNKRMFLSKFQNEQKQSIIGINDLEIETFQDTIDKDHPDKLGSVQRLKRIHKAESSFNSEELMFLNRAVFYLLSTHGANLQFSKFIETLKVLQDGDIKDKLELVVQFLKLGREAQKFVRVDDFVNLVMSSMPQDILQNLDGPQELRKIFDDGQMLIAGDQLKEKLFYSRGPVKDILRCVLQS